MIRRRIYGETPLVLLCSKCLSYQNAFRLGSHLLTWIFKPSLPEASFGLRVLSLPASACPCVRVCVNPEFVCTITHHPFKLGSPNLIHRCKTPWLTSFCLREIDIDHQGQKLTLKSKFTPLWACRCNDLPPVQAKITKFGSEMQSTLIKIPIVWEEIDLDLLGQIELKSLKFHRSHVSAPISSFINLDCFMILFCGLHPLHILVYIYLSTQTASLSWLFHNLNHLHALC